MNAAQMPGMGDEITWGKVIHPNDPRQPYPTDAEGDDATIDLIAELRGWVDDAESAYEHGNDKKFLQCLRELVATASQLIETEQE